MKNACTLNHTGHTFSGSKSKTMLLVIFVLSSLTVFANANPQFPLKLGSNKRYLVDQRQTAFLIKEISAWGLIQALTETDESAFIDSVKKKGFNTLLVSIISFDTRFAGHPPDWQGIPPFSRQWDFSSFNPDYFSHVDRFLNMAADKGMLVLLVPCYLGYKGDGNQGWWDELISKENNPEKSRKYGQFLGARYKDYKNIIWVAGGDNSGGGNLFEHMKNIITGIKQSDKQHFWTGHFESSEGSNWSAGNALYASYIDINGLYDFTESTLGSQAPQYKTELNQYRKGKMIFQLDQSYEHDIPHSPDNENYQWIRRKNYDGLLSGCAGTSFSPGQPSNQCYTFRNWKPLMNTRGMDETSYCFKIFESRPWYLLVPDETDSTIIRGRGNFGKIDYICAAFTTDRRTFLAYLPVKRTLSINMARIRGTKARGSWYNPRNGKTVRIGEFEISATVDFTAPSDGDWLLIIDGVSTSSPPPRT